MNNSTIFRQTIIALLACVLCGTRVSAQAKPPVGENTIPVESPAVPAQSAPAAQVAESMMPDISGKWLMGKNGEYGEATIFRFNNGPGDFKIWFYDRRGFELLDASPHELKDAQEHLLKWSHVAQRFEVTVFDGDRNRNCKWTLQLLADGKTIRNAISFDEQAKAFFKLRESSEAELGKFLNQEWVRKEASDNTPASEAASAVADKPSAAPVADLKMPDITGTWKVRVLNPENRVVAVGEMEIRRVQNGATDFLIDVPWVREFTRISVKWSAARQRFEGEYGDDDDDWSKITLQPQNDRNSLRVILTSKLPTNTQRSKPAENNSSKTEEYVTQVWTRTSKTFSTTFPAKAFGLPEAIANSESPPDAGMLGSDRSRGDVRRTVPTPQTQALPDTPAAKQLVEQLGAQESAAASEAATIRQLQANGQAEQNQPPIAEHQRKLKNLLSTAFDLKLQWEELQVKELQSRLSRLERQIGQRKELREKIIARRGAELIEGAILKWNPDGSSPNQTANSRTNGDKSATSDVVRSSSTDQSYQEFAKKLGTMNSSVAEAEEDLKLAEQLVELGNRSMEIVTKARRQVAEAIRNRKTIQDEYTAVLRDLELQVESAQVEVDAAKKIADYHQQLVEQRVSPRQKLEDAQLRLKRATLTLERIKVRYELYKKAGEGVAADDPLNPKLSQMIVIDRPLDAESAAKLIWDKIGLKFGEPVTAEKLGSQGKKYRGGLPIVEVREVGSAREKAFGKGDVLVGLDKWETTSPDNVVWILKQFEAVPKPDQTDRLVKFFVARDGETRYGFLRVEGQTAGTSKIDPPQPTAKSLDQLLAVLQNDRDTNHVISALQQLGKLDLGDNAGRVVTAILAAMEFHDPMYVPVKGNLPVIHSAAEVLRPIARSAKVPVIVKTLKDGHLRAKMTAIRSLNDEAPLWEYANEPDFSVLAELLLAMAAGPDVELRGSALSFLARTLPITKIDSTELTTEERRNAVGRLTEAFPREQVLQFITDAAGDKDIRIVLTSAQLLRDMPEKLKETELSAKLAESLTKIIEGKFHDVTATASQRGQALSRLSRLRERGAPAVPVLIELLKSGNLEEGERNNTRPYSDAITRMKVILALGGIGPAAKEALPMLEAELELLDKKAKEDDLLSGSSRSRPPETVGGTTASVLRFAISSIKGESPNRGFGNFGNRPN